MSLNDQKELFSDAYLLAMTAVAGCSAGRPGRDNDSVDWIVNGRSADGFDRSPYLGFQLKCTANPVVVAGALKFPLPIKNYDDMRVIQHLPRVLVVVIVPEDITEWLDQSVEQLVMRRCAYWAVLRGMPARDNTDSVTIDVPLDQVFSVDALRMLMRREWGD